MMTEAERKTTTRPAVRRVNLTVPDRDYERLEAWARETKQRVSTVTLDLALRKLRELGR